MHALKKLFFSRGHIIYVGDDAHMYQIITLHLKAFFFQLYCGQLYKLYFSVSAY